MFQEAFDQHLDRLIKNCMDMNAGTKSRKLIVTIEVIPNDRRDQVTNQNGRGFEAAEHQIVRDRGHDGRGRTGARDHA